MAAHSWLRTGLALLAIVQGAVGVWGMFLPRSFYDDAPWVALHPPFNEHLVRDVGAFNLALGVVLGTAVVITERRLVTVALAAYLTFTVPHVTFHTTHLQGYSTADAVVQTAALTLTVLVPVALLWLAWRPRGDAAPGLSPRSPRRRSAARGSRAAPGRAADPD